MTPRYWISERVLGVPHHEIVTVVRRKWTDCGKPLKVGADGLPATGLFVDADEVAALESPHCRKCRDSEGVAA